MIRNYAPESTSTYPPAASRPGSNAPSTTSTHWPSLTERITDQVGRWYGRWVGGTFSDTGPKCVGPKCLDTHNATKRKKLYKSKYYVIYT